MFDCPLVWRNHGPWFGGEYQVLRWEGWVGRQSDDQAAVGSVEGALRAFDWGVWWWEDELCGLRPPPGTKVDTGW